MTFELDLKMLCEEFIEVLFDFKSRKEISEEELEIHLRPKLNFIKECERNINGKSI